MIILKALLKQRVTFLFILMVPILLGLIWLNYFQDPMGDIKVPVVLVDPFDQEITEELLNDVDTTDTFRLTQSNEIPLKALERGEVEAIFVLPENLDDKIMSGNLDEQIKWYRNERSIFDGLFKEQLASSIMTKAVRAEAANVVQNYSPDQSWDDMYEFGIKYFEPEPIFQMNFQNISGTQKDDNSNNQYYLLHLMVWLYLWFVLAYFTKIMLEWKAQNIHERLKTISTARSLRRTWFLLTFLITGSIGMVMYISLQWALLSAINQVQLGIDIVLLFVSALIFLVFTLIMKKKETLWALTLGYSITSSVIFFLIYFQMLSESWWTKLFLPSWILI